MVLEAFGQAVLSFGSVELWFFLIAGVVLGLVGGVIPGISGLTTLALILPFTFTMTLWQSLPLMMSVMAVVCNGGAVTAILLNVPGTTASAATTFDGFPMAQRGEAARAIGASQAASAIGGVTAPLVALALIPVILPAIMVVHSADMVFIVLAGLVFIGVLGSGSMLKGLMSGVIGLLLSFIGFHAATGIGRYTFGIAYLYDGLHVVPVVLGLFAVPEMIRLATRGGTISKADLTLGLTQVKQGIKEAIQHYWLVLRSGILGFIVGIIPGIGGTTAAFVAYGQAKKTSKHPETFGTGNVEGVISTEGANNAEQAGALLTTLALGIPGSGSLAIVLGAIIMNGVQPGPRMFTEFLDLSIALMLVLIIAGVIGATVCIVLAPQLARIALIPARLLVPLIMVIIFVGAFAVRGVTWDVLTTLVLSVLGLAMSRYGFNRPALFLAYVLGSEFERYFFISLQVGGPFFFLRPISLSLIFVMITMYTFGPIKRLIQRRRGAEKI